jgi:hypothetical protein
VHLINARFNSDLGSLIGFGDINEKTIAGKLPVEI